MPTFRVEQYLLYKHSVLVEASTKKRAIQKVLEGEGEVEEDSEEFLETAELYGKPNSIRRIEEAKEEDDDV